MTAQQLSIPFVNRPASRQRAEREGRSGVYGKRRKLIYDMIEQAGVRGMTWREIAEITGLHHGQVSSILSKGHSEGDLVALVAQRNRCHPYVAKQFQSCLTVGDYWADPSETVAGRRRRLADELARACRQAIIGGWTPEQRAEIARAIYDLDRLANR